MVRAPQAGHHHPGHAQPPRPYLEGQHDEDGALVPPAEDRLDEGPAHADEQDHDEERDALQEREEVVNDTPRLRRAGQPQVVVANRLEEHREGLEHQEDSHQVVDVMHLSYQTSGRDSCIRPTPSPISEALIRMEEKALTHFQPKRYQALPGKCAASRTR